MSDLIVVTYPDESRAAAVMKELRSLRSQDLLDLEDAGYVTKDPSGRVMLHEAVPLGSKTSTVSRLLWGDLAGALMMIPYPEATRGDVPGPMHDIIGKYGVDPDFVARFVDQMAPGSSAIVVLVRKSTPEKVLPQISKFGGNVMRTSLPKEKEAQLEQTLAQGPAQAKWTLQKGMTVQAKDGDVGKTADVISDPITGAQTYLVLESGPLLSKTDVTLPTTAIDWVAENTAHLKLSKADVAKLPSIPARERDTWAAGNPQNIELVVRLFDDMNTAGQALQVLDDADSQGLVDIYNAAVLTKDGDGQVKIGQRRDRDIRRTALFGVLLGALVGVVAGGPVGLAAGAAVGGAVGGGGAALIEVGFPKEFLQDVQARMTPGTSALVILIDQAWLDNLEMNLSQFGGEVLRQALTDSMVEGMVTSKESS